MISSGSPRPPNSVLCANDGAGAQTASREDECGKTINQVTSRVVLVPLLRRGSRIESGKDRPPCDHSCGGALRFRYAW
jgi:hypothetical protein